MKLLEIFTEYKVIVRGKGTFGRYDQLFEVVPKRNPKKVTLEDLLTYVNNLQKRYPDRHFYLRTVNLKGKTYHIITRKSYIKLPDGKRKYIYDRVPIYFDIENQKFYVPESYIKKRRKLANYIIMRTLGALGISQSRYIHPI